MLLLVLSAVWLVVAQAVRTWLVAYVMAFALHVVNGLFRHVTLYANTVAVVSVSVVKHCWRHHTVRSFEVAVAVCSDNACVVVALYVVINFYCAVA